MMKCSSKRPKRPFQTCHVCGCTTSYSFYGAIACDPCRTFFRRQVLSSRVLKCSNSVSNGMACLVTPKSRRECGKCRFDKCLAAGMKPYLVTAESETNQLQNNIGGKNNSRSSLASSSPSTLSPMSKFPTDDESGGSPFPDNSMRDESIVPAFAPIPIPSKFIDGQPTVVVSPSRKTVRFVLHEGAPFRVVEFFDIPHVRWGVTLEGPEYLAPKEEKSVMTSIRYQAQVFCSPHDGTTCLTLKKDGNISVVMNNLNDELTARMVETSTLFPIFENYPHLTTYPLPATEATSSSTSMFKIECTMESTFTYPLTLDRVIPSFEALPSEDRVTLVRYSVVEICVLNHAYRCDRESKTFIRRCLDGLAYFIFSIEGSSTKDILYHHIYAYVKDFDDHLRKDDMIIHLMSFICLFKDREGLKDRATVRRERLMYLTLLSKYVEAKYGDLDKQTQDSFVQKVLDKVAQAAYIQRTYESLPVDEEVAKMMLASSVPE